MPVDAVSEPGLFVFGAGWRTARSICRWWSASADPPQQRRQQLNRRDFVAQLAGLDGIASPLLVGHSRERRSPAWRIIRSPAKLRGACAAPRWTTRRCVGIHGDGAYAGDGGHDTAGSDANRCTWSRGGERRRRSSGEPGAKPLWLRRCSLSDPSSGGLRTHQALLPAIWPAQVVFCWRCPAGTG